MRRLDWFLAAIVALFLMGAVAIEAGAWTFHALGAARVRAGDAAGAIQVRRLVSHLPNGPILPGEAR